MSGDTSNKSIEVGILTVSDRCSKGEQQDLSGENLARLISTNSSFQGNVIRRKVVPDDIVEIQTVLKLWSDQEKVHLILTTGGTGLSPRDVTPEATKSIIEKEATGISIAMMKGSLDITPLAMLSRSVCGIRKQSLIVNLPGSKKGSEECLLLILSVLPHAISLIRNDHSSVKSVHQHLSSHHCSHDLTASGDSKILNCPEKVARRNRRSPYPAISISSAQDIILKEADVLSTRTVSFSDALGKVLSMSVYAKDPLPPFPASIKDGYAVIASDGDGLRKVIGSSSAGSESSKLQITPGYCMRINTGAAVPPGADAVVQVEDTELIKEADLGKTELEIKISSLPMVGQDIRPIGNDIKQGQQVLKAGMKLGPSELGILATVGVTEVPVFNWPTVTVLSTGNELVEPNEPLPAGRIRDSNKTTLLALLQKEGFPTVDLGIARDDLKHLRDKIQLGLVKGDVLVTTGGVSMGDMDFLKPILISEFGGTIHFGRVFMKPGLPTTFATILHGNEKSNITKKLVFSLPGNPVSATVTCHLFVLPALRKMMGLSDPLPAQIQAKLVPDIYLDVRPEFHRAYLKWSDAEKAFKAESTGNQMSSRLLSMKEANCLIALPPRSDHLIVMKSGEFVTVYMI